MVDIHSHILPAVDDGSDSVETSIKLLKLMKAQNITDVIATPHFYAYKDNLEEYNARVANSFNILKDAVKGKNLPNIYLGSEVLYFKGISTSDSITNFCLNGSDYILLELSYNAINLQLFDEILQLTGNYNIIPIIAHLERYCKYQNYNKLLKFIAENKILTQINASSVVDKAYCKTTKKLLKKELVCFVGTDAHSITERPPEMDLALLKISNDFGEAYMEKLIENSQQLLCRITTKNKNYNCDVTL